MENKFEYRIQFSERLTHLIENRNLSNIEVARAIQVSTGLITKYKSAKASPSYENFIQLADFFCVSLDFMRGQHITISQVDRKEQVEYLIKRMRSMNLEKEERKLISESLFIYD